MNVSSTALYNSVFYLNNNKAHTESNDQDSNFIEEYNNAQKELINQNKSHHIWEEISSNYNVRNASFKEISDISLKLYEAGEISFSDHAILSFDWSRGFDGLRQNSNLFGKSDLNLTQANTEGRRDWIAEFEARIERDLKHNNLLGYGNNKRVLNILNKLDLG